MLRIAGTMLLSGAVAVGLGVAPASAATPVKPLKTSLSIHASKTKVAHDHEITLTGVLKGGSPLKALGGQPVKLEKRAAGKTKWTLVATHDTTLAGTVTFSTVAGTKAGT